MSNLTLSAILTIIDEASKPLKAIQNYSESSSDSIAELNQSIRQLNQTLGGSDAHRYNQSLKQTEKNTSAVRSASRLLVSEYGHVDHALTALLHKTDQWNAKLAQSRKNMRQELKNTIMGVAGLSYIASVPIKAFADAEEASTQLKVSMMDTTGKVAPEFAKINELATRLGERLPGSNADFQLMMTNLVQQGISFKSILGGTGEAAGNLAVLLKMPFDEAATFAAKMQDATQTAEKDMLSLMDTIQRTNYLGVDPSNMLGGFAKLGAGMKTIKQLGLDGANAMAPLLVMADQSGMTDLSSAGNAYSKIFKAMLDQGKINKAIKGTNLQLDFSDGKGEFAGLDKMFKELEKLKGFSTQARNGIISDIFGNDAENMQVLNLLINKGHAGYDETIAKMQRQADLQTRINALLGTLKNQWDQAQGAMTNAMVDITAAIEPDLKAFIKRIGEIAGRISAWAKANPELVRTLANIAIKLLMLKVALLGVKYTTNLFFGAIISVIAGITKLTILLWVAHKIADKFGIGLPSRFTVISKAIQFLSRAFFFLARQAIPLVIAGIRALAIAVLTNPLTLIITAIIAVALVIYRYWGPIKAFFQGFWSGLMIGLAPFRNTISSLFNTMKTTLAPLKPLWDGLVVVWTIFKGVLAEALTPFQATNQELANATAYGSSFGVIIGSVIGIIGELILSFVQLSVTILTTVGTAIGVFFGWMSLLPDRVGKAFNALKSYVKEAGAAFVDFLLTPLRLVIDTVNLLIKGINKIPSINIPKIPQLPTFSAPTVTTPTKTVTPTRAIPFPSRTAQTTNHFMGAQISITGVNDPKQVAMLVDQKLKQHQNSITAQQQRTYTDRD